MVYEHKIQTRSGPERSKENERAARADLSTGWLRVQVAGGARTDAYECKWLRAACRLFSGKVMVY